ncbi:hypothetical protein GCM10023203_56860 [Actinomycetospora straminea]|uniref:Uncharacterized protein n=1 Tax=Actinomycetospora straminea TaxID=663607 RepID=A0ABP9F7H4_9PSEU
MQAGLSNAEVFEEVRVPSGHTMNHLFVLEPAQWALRGDPFLWRELRTRGRRVPFPSALEDVAGRLRRMISEVIEQDWDGVRGHEYVFHPVLAHGGTSSCTDHRGW